MNRITAYEMGKDCALNAANVKNCSFTIFLSPETTKAWQNGKRAGEKASAADNKDGGEA